MATAKISNFFKSRDVWEKAYVIDGLQKLGGNIVQTARAMGLSRRSLQLKIQMHGINSDRIRAAAATKSKRVTKSTKPKKRRARR